MKTFSQKGYFPEEKQLSLYICRNTEFGGPQVTFC